MDETKRSAVELQQQLGGLFGARDIISWDLYDEDDRQYLVRKIELLMPNVEGAIEHADKENARLEKLRTTLVTALWNQRKFHGGKLLMSIQYVVCTKVVENPEEAINETEYYVYPLFRVRKCRKEEDSANCCMVFIDDNARVYQNWEDYKENNILPKGILVAPKNGCYNFDKDDHILLECSLTPAARLLSRVGNAANKTAGIVGVGAAAVTLSALAFPVVAPVLGVAALVGLGSGLWGAGASAKRLIDRKEHEESINLKDSKSRSDWIGVAGGVVSLGTSGATAALSQHVAIGQKASEVLVGAVSGLNIATIAISGVGVGNGVFEIILKRVNEEEISAIDVAQLGSSLFLLTHSVYNFETASRIVTTAPDRTIQSTRDELSKRQRELLDNARKQIVHLLGPNKGRTDVIRALNSMPDSKHLENHQDLDDASRLKIINSVIDTICLSTKLTHSDKVALEDTINSITAHITSIEVLDKMARIAGEFHSEHGEEIGRQLTRFLPLDEVMWVVFKIAYKLCEGENVSEFIGSVNDAFIVMKIQSYYKKLIPNLGEKKECKMCGGSFTICTALTVAS